MDIRKLQRAIVDGLEDVKAQNIAVFNTEHLSSMFERVIIASGTSNRQTKSLAASVRESVKSRGMPVLSTEGEDNGEWIIVDCGAAVAHIMQPSIRDYYHLEEIWGAKAVRMKMGEAKPGLVKASEPAPPLGRSNAARKGHALAAEPKRVVAKKAAKKSPARKAAATRAAGPAPAVKRAAAKKAPARKAAAKPRAR
jgi:ribosome-associated protein